MLKSGLPVPQKSGRSSDWLFSWTSSDGGTRIFDDDRSCLDLLVVSSNNLDDPKATRLAAARFATRRLKRPRAARKWASGFVGLSLWQILNLLVAFENGFCVVDHCYGSL